MGLPPITQQPLLLHHVSVHTSVENVKKERNICLTEEKNPLFLGKYSWKNNNCDEYFNIL